MLDFSFTEEQEDFKRTLKKLATEELLPSYTKWDKEKKLPRHLWKRLGDVGITGLRVPEHFGGSAADCVTTGIAAEEIGRGDFNLTYAVMLNALIGEIIATHASEELKEEFLPVLASGEEIFGIAITEPDAGTDAAGIKTSAVDDGDVFVLNGEKSGISVATEADAFVFCKNRSSTWKSRN
ncbi:acyl-CoA dehydrogenase family protein [Geomicrobium sp. JCM 19038]|uniref:acyl-CoA dehydrogenase family protein n=1 Tax=Geomicrobium sp. JCM 19038 TaxID=1460635 RepID=UPI001EE653D8|nr:acyl-CoA dehydrogenase family protein [Geomicrobium sp. JCM 19038]